MSVPLNCSQTQKQLCTQVLIFCISCIELGHFCANLENQLLGLPLFNANCKIWCDELLLLDCVVIPFNFAKFLALKLSSNVFLRLIFCGLF